MKPVRDDEQGMILINVLMFVAIASGLVLLMINREELALDRGLRTRESSRALAVVRGGELSALTALRRDAELAGDVDHAGEPWARVSESGAPIDGGTFDLAIADAEGRFNINAVRSGEAGSLVLFQTIGNEAGLTPEQIVMAVEYVRLQGPVTDLRPLRLAGIEPAKADRLERLVTALPGRTALNLNAADEEMLRILFRDPVVASRLAAVRARQGYLTLKDLTDQNVTMPWGASFRSNTFWVRTRATIGETSQQAATLIQRRRSPEGVLEVVPVERWRGAAVPPGVPPLPARS
ncbi:type II secretion system minor pseudopilin [Sphingomonas hengshuiensis]|uniref:Type II secretion system protein K n=1 Tax=Sphingomonas hengshuiensis TaxID=1609977 RepID=A0A7U4LFD6_9SPHN|nr:type II secretion system protein GspK [Sphingomonas hengshuiensis]AJP72163.1 Type II secretory pathway component PulK-like protein [Sphingomonas hengshuiensis]